MLVALLVLGIDQLSKYWAEDWLPADGGSRILPGPVDLTLIFNRSNAFGLAPVAGEFSRWGLTALNLGVVAILVWIVLRRPMPRGAMIGLAFIAAGATGNALDRIRTGAVIDFLNASKIGFVWVFNLADVSLDIGIGLVLLGMLRSGPASGKVR